MRSGLFGRSTATTIPGPGRAAGPALTPPGPSGPVSPEGMGRPISGPARERSRDPLWRLPEPARSKNMRLRQTDQELGDVLTALDARRAAAANRKGERQSFLDRMVQTRASQRRPVNSVISTYISGRDGDPGPGGVIHHAPPIADNTQMEEAQAEVDAATAELRDINARIAEVNQRKTRLVSNLNAWLAALPPRVMLEPYTAPPSKSKAVGGVEGVEALRAQILKKRADMSRIAAAPVTYDMSVAAMRAQITRLAEAGKPNILGCAEDARPVQFVTQQISGDVLLAQGAGITTFVQPNLLALFCYLHGDALMAKLEDELADLADPAGLSDEAKASQIAALEAEVLELERQEEAAIMLSEATGAPIARRADANPLAVLELVAA